MKRIAIIDGNSLINRAYYAMRNPMITKEGIYTQGIFSFLNMLEKIKDDYSPEYMAIAFDMKAPTFRHKEYSEYKAGRKKMPPELAMQIPLLKDILEAMNIKQLEMEGFEADDLIGTVAGKAEDEDLEAYIITGDRDELQLASDSTKVIITRKGVSEFDIYDKQAMIDKYGFTPEQFIDYKGLMGDQSDNIPGVPGVGEKTAKKLITEFGSIEKLLEDTDAIKPDSVKKKIEDNAQLAVMSKRLATINTHVPITVDFNEYLLTEPDYDKLIELYKKLEFNRFLRKLDVNGGAAPTDTHTASIDTSSFEKRLIDSDEELGKITLKGRAVIKVFGDGSHTEDGSVDGISVINGEKYYYFNCHKLTGFTEWLSSQDVKYAGHDLKQDYFMLMRCGIDRFDTDFDTAIAQYVLDSGRSNYSFTALVNEYLHMTVKDEKEFFDESGQVDMFTDNDKLYMDYGFEVCSALVNLMDIQRERIIQEDLEKVFYEVELPLIQVMASMENEGFKVDKEELRQFGDVLADKIDETSAKVFEMAGEEFNLNSPIQLGEILFEKLGLPAGKKTKRGYSTSADILEKIKDEHPIVPEVLEYRMLSKLKSTYIDGLMPLINDKDGKVHAHFNQTVTATGRISCTEPNLQNIPVRNDTGRQLRKAFIPNTDDCILVGADYSQIELRVLAHMSEDEGLIDAFNRGEDIHRATAANVLGVPAEEITVQERSRAKAVNFGVIYGMSSFGLSSELDITRKEADEYINTYFDKHEAVKTFMDGQVESCRENGFVTTIMGRKRYINEIKASSYQVRQIGERLAMNTPIQGSAADIIKTAMIRVYKAIKEKGLRSKLILQVHDELIINTFKDEKEIVEKLLTENMENAYEMAVSLRVELNEGENWYELK